MKNEEIKQKIATIEKAITALKKQNGSPEQIQKLQNGLAKYESMLEPEQKKETKKSKSKTKQKKVSLAKPKSKPQPISKKVVSVNKKYYAIIGGTKQVFPSLEAAKKAIKPQFHNEIKPLSEYIKTPKPKFKIVKKALETQAPITKKTLFIKKDKKEEKHTIETSFGKDINNAILVLNKERFRIKEIKNKETGKTEPVKHSVEYKNAKTIQSRVNSIFDAAVYDIAKTRDAKKEKKDIIEIVNDIRDLHSLWLNEIDIIIANEDSKDLEKIRELMLGLMKEARKNDVDNKWRNAGGLEELALKFKL
jgi:hypothetical protein